jgi:hypothetical protein
MARYPSATPSHGPGEVVSFRSLHRRRRRLPKFAVRLPAPTTLGGWGLALLMASWVVSILSMLPLVGSLATIVSLPLQAVGATLLVAALLRMLMERKSQPG